MKPSEAKSLPAWDAALGNASAHEQHSLSTSRTRAQRPCKRLEGCPSQVCTRTPVKRTIDSARRCENSLDPKPVKRIRRRSSRYRVCWSHHMRRHIEATSELKRACESPPRSTERANDLLIEFREILKIEVFIPEGCRFAYTRCGNLK